MKCQLNIKTAVSAGFSSLLSIGFVVHFSDYNMTWCLTLPGHIVVIWLLRSILCCCVAQLNGWHLINLHPLLCVLQTVEILSPLFCGAAQYKTATLFIPTGEAAAYAKTISITHLLLFPSTNSILFWPCNLQYKSSMGLNINPSRPRHSIYLRVHILISIKFILTIRDLQSILSESDPKHPPNSDCHRHVYPQWYHVMGLGNSYTRQGFLIDQPTQYTYLINTIPTKR